MLHNNEPLVLIVESDIARAKEILRAMKLERVSNSKCVTNGIELLKYAKNRMPELIVMPNDIEISKQSSICRLIKSMPSGESCIIVVLLDETDNKAINQAYAEGADGFEPKTLPHRTLAKKVRYYLRSRRSIAGFYQLEHIVDELGIMAHVGFWQWKPETNQFFASAMVSHLYRTSKRSLKNFTEFLDLHTSSQDKKRLYDVVERVREDGISRVAECTISTPSGNHVLYHQIKSQGLFSDSGFIITGHVRDITNKRTRESRLLEMALYDEVTQLPSMGYLKKHLPDLLRIAEEQGHYTSLVLMNVDGFSRVNEAFGFAVGDELLQRISKRLTSICHSDDEDQPEHLLVKLDADEFGILLHPNTKPEDTTQFVHQVQQLLSNPFVIEELSLNITVSMGIAIYPLDCQSADDLIASANTALKYAKRQGRNTYQYFMQSLNQESFRRLGLESDLRSALVGDQLSLYYQPKVSLSKKTVDSAEALLRWNHPQLGMVSPDEFISLAEDIGLMQELGEWVINAACKQAKKWLKAGNDYRIAVNISSTQLNDSGDFVTRFRNILERHQLPPHCIELELTESIFLENAELYDGLFKQLKDMGVHIAIDDFGTGYSSLSYLMNLSADTLKIDRSFIQSVSENYQQSQVVKSIIDLAKKINMSVVAEGVSSQLEEDFLLETDCDFAQGYYYSPALPPKEFEGWVKEFNKKHGN